jgi:hypothetical protein
MAASHYDSVTYSIPRVTLFLQARQIIHNGYCKNYSCHSLRTSSVLCTLSLQALLEAHPFTTSPSSNTTLAPASTNQRRKDGLAYEWIA